MAEKTLDDIAEKMRDIDIAIMSTKTDGGAIASRPMSNNRQVDFGADSYYFTMKDTRTIDDIQRDPKISLGFTGEDHFYVTVEAKASLIESQDEFEEHWSPDLDRWFPEGIDTPGLVMIKAKAERLHYWDGEDEGDIAL